MPSQLTADMNAVMAAFQFLCYVLSALAFAVLAIYLAGIALLCLSERQKNSAFRIAGQRGVTGPAVAGQKSSQTHRLEIREEAIIR